MNEDAARWMTNVVLFACIFAERSTLDNSSRQPVSYISTHVSIIYANSSS